MGYGHIETMANTVAEGARGVNGADVVVKRVPETMADEAFLNAGGKADQGAPVADPKELADYDAIIFGTPTRFGNMAGQMRTFLDQTGGLWAEGKLHGKGACPQPRGHRSGPGTYASGRPCCRSVSGYRR